MATQTSSSKLNMPEYSAEALESLIRQLLGGGTPEIRAQQQTRTDEISRTRGQQNAYSKEMAFADSQGAVSAAMRRALEQLMPSITRAAEGAGTSANSMRSLLMQDAAQKAAESAATTGLNAAVQYGGLSAQFASVLESLTRPNPVNTEALIQALSVARGSVDNIQNQSRGPTYVPNSGLPIGTSFPEMHQPRPTAPLPGAPSGGGSFGSFGPIVTDPGILSSLINNYVGGTDDTLGALNGNPTPWDSYTF
jgi:hypothetical protein